MGGDNKKTLFANHSVQFEQEQDNDYEETMSNSSVKAESLSLYMGDDKRKPEWLDSGAERDSLCKASNDVSGLKTVNDRFIIYGNNDRLPVGQTGSRSEGKLTTEVDIVNGQGVNLTSVGDRTNNGRWLLFSSEGALSVNLKESEKDKIRKILQKAREEHRVELDAKPRGNLFEVIRKGTSEIKSAFILPKSSKDTRAFAVQHIRGILHMDGIELSNKTEAIIYCITQTGMTIKQLEMIAKHELIRELPDGVNVENIRKFAEKYPSTLGQALNEARKPIIPGAGNYEDVFTVRDAMIDDIDVKSDIILSKPKDMIEKSQDNLVPVEEPAWKIKTKELSDLAKLSVVQRRHYRGFRPGHAGVDRFFMNITCDGEKVVSVGGNTSWEILLDHGTGKPYIQGTKNQYPLETIQWVMRIYKRAHQDLKSIAVDQEFVTEEIKYFWI